VTRACDDEDALGARLATFRHRIYQGQDVTALLVGARRLQRAEGSLGQALARRWSEEGRDLRAGLSRWVADVRAAGGLDRLAKERRGATHLLSDPAGASASKRLMLMLRWLVRPADGVDLGVWSWLPPSALVVPLDVHIHKLASNLGLTRRRSAGWKAAQDVTRALSRLDPADPVKFDFSLCHLGMVQGCPSRRDPVRCEGCGVRPVCRHWAGRR
jgi:uncharacterized protein (TIGR02757 family)